MNHYLAKSTGETIVQHTKRLLHQLKTLKEAYPNALSDSNWKLLKIACQYHDLGKMNLKFQTKLQDGRRMENGEIPHALLSASLLPLCQLREEGVSTLQLEALVYAIALHHDRNFDEITDDQYQKEIHALIIPASHFDFGQIGLHKTVPRKLSARYFVLNFFPSPSEEFYEDFVKLKGMLNRIDFAASGHYAVESSPRVKVDDHVLPVWRKNDPSANWNRLQIWTKHRQNENIVVIGQTGMGKTEGALRWLGDSKGFFLLPLRSAINSIYLRLGNSYALDDTNLALLHSDMLSFLLSKETSKNQKFNVNQLMKEINESRQLSKQLTVATLDQLFNFVYRYRGYESKLATLSYSKVVIDEIQMYSPDLLAYILYGLKLIQDYGGHFQIMTATLAPFVVDLMKHFGLLFDQPSQAFIDNHLNHRHSVKVEHKFISDDDVLAHYNQNKVLVVCNTISQAENLYDRLKSSIDNLHLIHSRFIKKDRNRLEREICHFARSSSTENGVWIGTQVVEASLDIDFDVLLTELSELNGLFQRMGRCYRKRNYSGKGYNVFVFDGGESEPSGINKGNDSVVDYGLYKLTKNALKDVDGFISEEEKIELISQTYSMDNVQKESPEYISAIINTVNYLKSISNDQLSKSDVIHRFRNIDSVDVIPEQVYLDNKEVIDSAVEIITETHTYKSKEEAKKDKIIASEKIKEFSVSVPLWMTGKGNVNLIDVDNLYHSDVHILSRKFAYDSKRGLSNQLSHTSSKSNDNIF